MGRCMQFKRLIFLVISIVFTTLISTAQASAQTVPSFPSCINPQGSLKVSYSEGTHGIVGRSESYTGSDAVYRLNEDTLTQCFCADDGSGIQTNWWKASSLSENEIQTLRNQGWYYVPNGGLWGLSADPYLAQNSSYTCRGGIGGGDILGSELDIGSILGLAATGNIGTLYILAGVAITSLIISFALRPRKSR